MCIYVNIYYKATVCSKPNMNIIVWYHICNVQFRHQYMAGGSLAKSYSVSSVFKLHHQLFLVLVQTNNNQKY